jgi:hypothetical protein
MKRVTSGRLHDIGRGNRQNGVTGTLSVVHVFGDAVVRSPQGQVESDLVRRRVLIKARADAMAVSVAELKRRLFFRRICRTVGAVASADSDQDLITCAWRCLWRSTAGALNHRSAGQGSSLFARF